jgi:FKBP-type peptidyl-prolyl cis-trans isomerase SlyD
MIDANKVISLHYSLSVVNEDQSESFMEKTNDENPLVFISGIGNLLPAFEENLWGKNVGDTFDFILSAEDGYGTHEAEKIANLPIGIFLDESGQFDGEMIKVGNYVPMMDNNGHQHQGLVTHVGLENITMDFNHPMAGKTLHFTGSINDIREATSEELDHGHVHGPGGHEH